MIKIVIFSLTILFLVSCTQVNSSNQKNVTKGDDTVSEVDISISKIDALNSLAEMDETQMHKLLFKAQGMEPGWFAEFYDNKMRLVVDYGKDSLLINDKFEISELDKAFAYSKAITISGKNVAVSVSINSTPCTSPSGDKEDRSVSVKFNNKEYKGCGSFIK